MCVGRARHQAVREALARDDMLGDGRKVDKRLVGVELHLQLQRERERRGGRARRRAGHPGVVHHPRRDVLRGRLSPRAGARPRGHASAPARPAGAGRESGVRRGENIRERAGRQRRRAVAQRWCIRGRQYEGARERAGLLGVAGARRDEVLWDLVCNDGACLGVEDSEEDLRRGARVRETLFIGL